MNHDMIKIYEDEEIITQKCKICNRIISFSKIYEPKTNGELPDNFNDYIDPCENKL